MTATRVGDLTVIADEPARSPITDRNGGAVYFKQIRELLLEDDTVVYGCVHCDYTGPSPGNIRGHLGKHTPRKAAEAAPSLAAPEPIDPAAITLAELLDAVQSSRERQADAERWKARALRAEQDLALIRRTLGKA